MLCDDFCLRYFIYEFSPSQYDNNSIPENNTVT